MKLSDHKSCPPWLAIVTWEPIVCKSFNPKYNWNTIRGELPIKYHKNVHTLESLLSKFSLIVLDSPLLTRAALRDFSDCPNWRACLQANLSCAGSTTQDKGESPMGFYNPVILTQHFQQSRNPESYFWHPISCACFQPLISSRFCFEIPNSELQIREIP